MALLEVASSARPGLSSLAGESFSRSSSPGFTGTGDNGSGGAALELPTGEVGDLGSARSLDLLRCLPLPLPEADS